MVSYLGELGRLLLERLEGLLILVLSHRRVSVWVYETLDDVGYRLLLLLSACGEALRSKLEGSPRAVSYRGG